MALLQGAVERIKADAILSKRLQIFPVPSISAGARGGGTQNTNCLKLNAIGWWLATLSLANANIRAELRTSLLDFQESLLLAADDQLRGGLATVSLFDDPTTRQIARDFHGVHATIAHMEGRLGKVGERIQVEFDDADVGHGVEQPFVQDILEIYQWGARLPVACDADATIYIPLRALCTYLGITHQQQIRRLRADPILQTRLREFALTYPKGGTHPTTCLRINAIGWWLATISINATNIRPELRDGLLDFQEALFDAADILLRGDATDARAISPAQMRAYYLSKIRQYDTELAGVRMSLLRFEKRLGTLERTVRMAETIDEDE